jgi:hypothetical protein
LPLDFAFLSLGIYDYAPSAAPLLGGQYNSPPQFQPQTR